MICDMICAAEFKVGSFLSHWYELLVLLEHPPSLGLGEGIRDQDVLVDQHGMLTQATQKLSFLFFLIVLLNWDLDRGDAALASLLPVSKILFG